MACIKYKSSNVTYDGQKHARLGLINKQTSLIAQGKDELMNIVYMQRKHEATRDVEAQKDADGL